MGGEGHMLDMIRRLKDGKEASRLRRERRNDKLGRLRRNNDPYLLPDTTPEEMERIIKDSEKKKEKDNSYFVWNAHHYGRTDRMCCPPVGNLFLMDNGKLIMDNERMG